MAMPLGPGVLLSSIFSATALEFKRNLPEGLTDAFAEIYTLEDLEHAIQDIEVSQAGRKSLRYLNKIKPCLHALNDYSKTIEVFVNAKPDIMAFVWGPIKVCLLVGGQSSYRIPRPELTISARSPLSMKRRSMLYSRHTSRSKLLCPTSLPLNSCLRRIRKYNLS